MGFVFSQLLDVVFRHLGLNCSFSTGLNYSFCFQMQLDEIMILADGSGKRANLLNSSIGAYSSLVCPQIARVACG